MGSILDFRLQDGGLSVNYVNLSLNQDFTKFLILNSELYISLVKTFLSKSLAVLRRPLIHGLFSADGQKKFTTKKRFQAFLLGDENTTPDRTGFIWIMESPIQSSLGNSPILNSEFTNSIDLLVICLTSH